MKRLLFLLAALPLMFVGCSEEEEDFVPEIVLSAESLDLHTGDEAKLDYQYTSSKGVEVVSSEWTSSDSEIVKVDGNGYLYALKEGAATIRITLLFSNSMTIEKACKVAVSNVEATGITLSAIIRKTKCSEILKRNVFTAKRNVSLKSLRAHPILQ